ncbi:PRC-barrel domain-containing protein [Deinococcus sp. KNUC1210]|uniref:PRC-barrel domain-containing protein n=1 Tax=Deinococcus sp. KNUC1210 TaxID=2917691 RepID=UPI001EF1078A|nr:PRC-barrel domain-containing protein [Deinococcus sp. KNUC1210]ULH16142.1 PRC-barrel domain-containing protein [Deinococcus sp. KNUC1210]
MLKGKELIGRNLVTLDGGERVDSIHDLIFDEQGNRVLALLIDEGGWFHAAKVLPYTSVRSVGEDAVMIDAAADVVNANDDATVSAAMQNKVGLIGLNLLTTDGKELGRISDVFFDEMTGRVVGYEATGGLFSDLSSGRTFVPAPESITIGAEAALVPPEVAQAMQEQEAGGLQGALGSVASSVKDAAGTVADRAREVAGNVGDATKAQQKAFVVGKVAAQPVVSDSGISVVQQGDVITQAQADEAEALGLLGSLTASAGGSAVQELYGQVRESVQGGVQNLSAEAERPSGTVADFGDSAIIRIQPDPATQVVLQPTTIVGRRLQRDVLGPNRSFVAAQGQIVTPALIERARALGRENDLIAAVVTPQTTQASAMNDSVAAASDRLAAGAQTVKEGAAGLLDRARGWLNETRDRAQEDAETAQIERALGRPVNRVVLDREDHIILNIGEIITHKAVEQSRAAGVLNILLTSVSTEPVVIDPLSVKPAETGQAALDSQPVVPSDLNKPRM